MARVAPKPKSLAKKKVSPITAGVVIAVVLAMVVFVYTKYGKEKTGWEANTKEGRQIMEQVGKLGGWRGFGKAMAARRARMQNRRGGRGMGGREGRRRGPAPKMDERRTQQTPASSSLPGGKGN